MYWSAFEIANGLPALHQDEARLEAVVLAALRKSRRAVPLLALPEGFTLVEGDLDEEEFEGPVRLTRIGDVGVVRLGVEDHYHVRDPHHRTVAFVTGTESGPAIDLLSHFCEVRLTADKRSIELALPDDAAAFYARIIERFNTPGLERRDRTLGHLVLCNEGTALDEWESTTRRPELDFGGLTVWEMLDDAAYVTFGVKSAQEIFFDIEARKLVLGFDSEPK
ncbi:MAG: hypothetical protein IT290_07760 [Deltaproteobacteria bacterium]|nr:hypothetical protein [Deltaproteobacteria bacterium]